MFSKIFKNAQDDHPYIESRPQTCTGCLWRRDGVSCDAFPKGIPLPILLGQFDHHYHYEDENVSDDGVTFDPA